MIKLVKENLKQRFPTHLNDYYEKNKHLSFNFYKYYHWSAFG